MSIEQAIEVLKEIRYDLNPFGNCSDITMKQARDRQRAIDTILKELKKMQELKDDIKFTLSFCPKEKPKDLPKGMCPTMYHSLTYEGDLKIAERLDNIRNKVEDKS